MKTSIATVSLSGSLTAKLAAIAEAGFDGIEIFEQDFLASDFTPAEVGRMVRDHGLEITLFQPFRDFEGLPEPHRSRALARVQRKFDLMNQLGTDLMLVCSTTHPAAIGGIDRMAHDFRDLGDLASRHGIRVGFEALCWGRFVNDHRDAWEVVRRADHPNVGLILDSFHTLARRIDPSSIRAIARPSPRPNAARAPPQSSAGCSNASTRPGSATAPPCPGRSWTTGASRTTAPCASS